MYYQPDYINNCNSILKKRNPLSDLFFLFTKIIIIIIFIFDSQNESEEWGIIIFICILTGFNAYCNLSIQKYSNIIIKRFNNILSLILFFAFLILLIEKILNNIKFNGGMYYFFL